MTLIKTQLGQVKITDYTKRHCKRSRHGNPENKEGLIQALSSGQFTVAEVTQGLWMNRPVPKIVLVVQTHIKPMIVVLKRFRRYFLMVTAYVAHSRQINRLLADAFPMI